MKNKYISWRRVSTFRQSKSGLGLEAQKEIIRFFVERDGGELIADYAECYTGKELSGCKELRKAMNHAKKEGATLIIAKSDRFRNCQEALGILDEMGEGNIEFCDIPHTDRFTLTLFFALAEREALLVSIRTKQALAAKKARGEATGGACPKWKQAYKNKTKEQRKEENMKRGTAKNMRHLESRDVKSFIKILKGIFPNATSDENLVAWDWSGISTKDGIRQRILATMKDYRDIDPTLFVKWNFDDDDRKLQVKLASYIGSLRASVNAMNKRNEYENMASND